MRPRTLSRFSTSIVLAVLCPGGAALAQGSGKSLVRQLYADVGVEVRREEAGVLLVAAAGADRTITVRLLARDLRRWADSASRVLVARSRVRSDSARWGATVEGPGLKAGSLSLSRTIAPPDTTISVLFADTEFETVRASLSAAEARAFVTAMRKAADAVLPAARARRGGAPPAGSVPPAAKPPEAKPPAAKPPAAKPPAAKPPAAKPPAAKPPAAKPPAAKPLATKPLATKPLATKPPAVRPPADDR